MRFLATLFAVVIALAALALPVIWYGGILYVLIHFITKFW